jgi:beta-galactosidase
MTTPNLLLHLLLLLVVAGPVQATTGPIRSGELHYSRIPRAYWSHRLKMARAMGLDTVSTYVFWNLHEPRPGEYHFEGELDVAEFCRQAQREGLKVLLRPGPYVCAEWDFGGLPWWLLKNRDLRVRSRSQEFLEPCRRYFQELGKQLAPLQVTRGGPITMVQVENEYDAFGRDLTHQ